MSEIKTIVLPDECTQIALCGGPYSNFSAVEAFLEATKNIEHRFCLGDMGGFGPCPDRTLDLLRSSQIICLQGNYDRAIAYEERDCGCGYSDPRDRHFAQLSYDYTFAKTSPHHREWLQKLPYLIRLEWREHSLLLCHGSPQQVNEFVWESETEDRQIAQNLRQFQVTGICCTHSGLPWLRRIEEGFWLNVGVLGRPPHEGKRHVYYAIADFPAIAKTPQPRLIPLAYDVETVVSLMEKEGLPVEFCESLQQGIWTTCGEILPEAEKTIRPRI
ncbi:MULTISPECIES: metallophosphoesterase family protein [Spirulina sp. CCY15215]|uniref:metallophosphoesterase family protein n=1 Tax=Spirulina sp. CCY15215 TaxID=2767591 RepID=UPI00194ED0F6|nr:metallophosphoesterase family protein [Spirulina major]